MSRTRMTEKQILKLKRNLNKIYKLKNEILKLADKPGNAPILKRKIAEILLLLESIASHANPKNEEFNSYIREANLRFVGMEIDNSPWPVVIHEVELFCKYLNSVAFHFTEEGVKILTRKDKKK
jgi:hypothetical protein